MSLLDKPTYQKIMIYYKKHLGWGFKCFECKKQAIIQTIHRTEVCDYVSWRCKHCKNTWIHEFDDLAISQVMNGS